MCVVVIVLHVDTVAAVAFEAEHERAVFLAFEAGIGAGLVGGAEALFGRGGVAVVFGWGDAAHVDFITGSELKHIMVKP